VVLRPGSKIRITTVSSRRGKSTLTFLLSHCPSPYHRSPRHHSRPSRSRRGSRAASCGCRGGTAGGAGPPDGLPSTRAKVKDRSSEPDQADCRFRQAITSRRRQGPPWLVMRPSQDGWGALTSPRRVSEVALGPAARTREFARMFSAVVTSASATGSSARKPALGQVRRGRAQAVGSSAGVIRRAWSLLPGLSPSSPGGTRACRPPQRAARGR
jgi:hypothetical protein